MLNRRRLLSLIPALQLRAALAQMTLCIHQTTSAPAGFRKSLEGYSRAGIKQVEVIGPHLDAFVKTDGMPVAKRLLSDLGMKAVSHGGVRGLWDPGPEHSRALEGLKHQAEMAAELGIDRMVGPCVATGKFNTDDYKTAVANMRDAGDVAKQFGVTLMVEFTRASTLIATLPTSLRLVREAAHPNVRPMLDFYHFWSGLNKFEDLEQIQAGEIHHVHFQDVPDMPRELLDSTTREIPGTGVTPIARILRALNDKGYAGPLSVELFLPKYQNAEPYDVARAIRENAARFIQA
ncbi:MAG TPA: sugar phosphate isomerase/epimerase [Bryobacteraceae bacterium]|nr:sugar phosphate isomerase/epimerase [Bryobacteraceae bacterium]